MDLTVRVTARLGASVLMVAPEWAAWLLAEAPYSVQTIRNDGSPSGNELLGMDRKASKKFFDEAI